MDNDKKEPQSYGSGEDWVTGDTGQTVNRLKGGPSSPDADFYASRHDQQPGTTPAEAVESEQPDGGLKPAAPRPASGAHDSVHNVTAKESGAKRQSYWKDRDYD
jgi:hypothetical protein